MNCRHFLATAMAAAISATAAASAPTIELTDCVLPGVAERARCGTLAVPEDPNRPQGRRLEIAIAVLPATTGKAEADPIVPLMGGPGEDAISAAAEFARRLAPLRADHDVVFVDQRGTGKSNRLRCDLHDPQAPAPNLLHLFPPAAVDACRRVLSQQADLTQYTYLNFANDLETVRRALGYKRLNLFAGSYGTRAAQVFARAYPASVHTVFQGSVVPIDEVTPLTMAKASQAMFDTTFDACAADAACRAAFPTLRDEFDEILDRLESGEVRVPIAGSADRAPLARGRVVEWLRARLYRPHTAAELPWLIHQAHVGNWSPIVDGILEQASSLDASYGIGLFFSITCAEDMAFLRDDEIPAASKGTFLGDYRVREQQVACADWPKSSLPTGYRDPVRSSLPTMFVTGDLDGAGPLWVTTHAAAGFSNRVVVIAHGQGHTEWSDCIERLYARFVRTGEIAGIDPAVCPAMPRPPFRT